MRKYNTTHFKRRHLNKSLAAFVLLTLMAAPGSFALDRAESDATYPSAQIIDFAHSNPEFGEALLSQANLLPQLTDMPAGLMMQVYAPSFYFRSDPALG